MSSRFIVAKILGIIQSEKIEVQMFGGDDAKQIFKKATRRHPKLLIVSLKSLGVALARVPESPGQVFQGKRFHEARRKKNRARKAGFVVRKVVPMEHLESIHAINTSVPIRQDRPIDAYMAELDKVHEFCEASTEIYGVFDPAGELVAYAHGTFCGEVFVLDRFIGHRSMLNGGIMFLLMYELVTDLVEARKVRGFPEWVQHDMYFVRWRGARQFKKETGFSHYRVKWSWNSRRSEIVEDLSVVDAKT